jgi:outer membrane protein
MKKLFLSITAMFLLVGIASAQRVACVDTKYILDNISEYRDAQSKLDALSIEWQKEIEMKFAEIDKLYKAFQAEAVLLPEDMKNKRQEEIINKEKEAKELQKKRFGSDGDLFKKRQELIKPIQDKVYNAIEDFATEKNYAIIFDKAGGMTVLYVNVRNDVSDDILKKLGYKPGAIQSDEESDYDE